MQRKGQLNSTVSNNRRVAIPYANEPSRQGMWSRIIQFFLARDTTQPLGGGQLPTALHGRNGNDRHPTGIHTSHVTQPVSTFANLVQSTHKSQQPEAAASYQTFISFSSEIIATENNDGAKSRPQRRLTASAANIRPTRPSSRQRPDDTNGRWRVVKRLTRTFRPK